MCEIGHFWAFVLKCQEKNKHRKMQCNLCVAQRFFVTKFHRAAHTGLAQAKPLNETGVDKTYNFWSFVATSHKQ